MDNYNEHILQNTTNPNSFIANVNYLARKFDSLMQVDEKFDVETVKLLAQLVKNALDINIKILSEDLRKGSYYGYRKLDIDLLTNFKDYDYFTSDETKNKLWGDPEKQVYYSSVDVWLSEDNTIILHKDFPHVINNHHQLFQELVNWDELIRNYGFTTINISPDTPIFNHELVRITDDYTSNTAFGTNAGSKIMRIALNVAKESGYNSLLVGAKEDVAVFTWVDSTSALLTIANKINDIIHAANVLNEVGTNIGEQIENAIATLQRLKNETQEIVDQAAQDTQDALATTKYEMSVALDNTSEALAEIQKDTINTLLEIREETVATVTDIHTSTTNEITETQRRVVNELDNKQQTTISTLDSMYQTATTTLTTMQQNAENSLNGIKQETVSTLQDIHQETVGVLENLKSTTVNETTALVNTARLYTEQVETAVNKQVNLSVEGTAVESDVAPSVEYDANANKLMFKLPRSESAIVGLTNFEIDTTNGHLVLSLRDSDDILNAYTNESGNIILEIKSGD